MKQIQIANKVYNVEVFLTEEEKEKGLQNVTELPKDQGALFVYSEPQTLSFWMKDCPLSLDVIFLNEEQEVISNQKGVQNSEDILEENDAMYVLEVNAGSGIEPGDEADFSEIEDESDEEMEEDSLMLIIGPKGQIQGELEGGERIFSRKHTKTLIRLQKRAQKSKSDADYKRLGKKIFQYIKTQDEQEPEYVELKN